MRADPGDDPRGGAVPALAFRRPTADDHPFLVASVDEWWGGRSMRALLPRLWFEHFAGTSWIAHEPDGRIVGFIVAFVSQDDPATGYVHMVAADPNRRQRGIGRALYDRVSEDLRRRGVRRLQAVTWPGNRRSIDFHRAIGFAVDDGPGTTPIYGTPAHADHDGPGEDRVVFLRDL